MQGSSLVDSARFTSVENLSKRLKQVYPNLAELEKLANENEVPIHEPFQRTRIGSFTVMAPAKSRFLNLIVESENTPEAVKEAQARYSALRDLLSEGTVEAAWGEETFPDDDTTEENSMSVVQYAKLCGKKILLTADAGRAALNEAADYAPYVGLLLPGIDRIQVPHHGSRHNVSSDILDRWLGKPLTKGLPKGTGNFRAIVSAAQEDDDNPRKSVVRGFMHRGAKVITTEDGSKRTGHNAPKREGWVTVEGIPYPEEQEH